MGMIKGGPDIHNARYLAYGLYDIGYLVPDQIFGQTSGIPQHMHTETRSGWISCYRLDPQPDILMRPGRIHGVGVGAKEKNAPPLHFCGFMSPRGSSYFPDFDAPKICCRYR